MKKGMGSGFAVLLCAVAQAAEPPAAPSQTPKPAVEKPAPLRLEVGDIRKYMMPNEFRELIARPDADKGTIVVQGARDPPPLRSTQPIPGGIIAPFWAIAHPTQSWRLLVPDLNAPALGPTIDKVPPPIFRWGP